MVEKIVTPRARPFFFPGDRTGCLLVHGFTGSPTEMLWLGEYLAECGFTVLGVRLMGHATRPADMNRARWRDWLAGVEDGWYLLEGQVDRIVLVGLSMGGVLSAIQASRFPAAGLVMMSTPHTLPDDIRLRFVKLLSPVLPFHPKEDPDSRDPEARNWHVCYDEYPTRALAELRTLVKMMRRALPKVRAPVLLVNSRADTAVPPEHQDAIREAIGSPIKESLWLEDSAHAITLEPERDELYRAIASFISRLETESA